MAHWTFLPPHDQLGPAADAAWGFGGLDGGEGDWDDWFAGIDALTPRPDHAEEDFAAAPHSFLPLPAPSPVHGGYASWLSGGNPSSTRDPPASHPPTSVVATSSSYPAATGRAPPSRQPASGTLPPPSSSAPHPPSAPPIPNHSNNWLDPTEARRPAPTPYIPSHFETLAPDPPGSPSTSDDSDYGIDIDDLLNDDDDDDDDEEDGNMSPVTRRAQRQPPRTSIVDLTDDPSSPPRPTASRKRLRDEGIQGSASNQRSRRASAASTPRAGTAIECLDLTNEAPSVEEGLLQSQQQSAIAAQQASSDDRPLRVGQRTCIICMEPYTNATITACGHIYCHECLTQALIAGEKNSERGVGNCPVCRKPISRKKDRQVIPVAFMKREAFKGKRAAAAGV